MERGRRELDREAGVPTAARNGSLNYREFGRRAYVVARDDVGHCAGRGLRRMFQSAGSTHPSLQTQRRLITLEVPQVLPATVLAATVLESSQMDWELREGPPSLQDL